MHYWPIRHSSFVTFLLSNHCWPIAILFYDTFLKTQISHFTDVIIRSPSIVTFSLTQLFRACVRLSALTAICWQVIYGTLRIPNNLMCFSFLISVTGRLAGVVFTRPLTDGPVWQAKSNKRWSLWQAMVSLTGCHKCNKQAFTGPLTGGPVWQARCNKRTQTPSTGLRHPAFNGAGVWSGRSLFYSLVGQFDRLGVISRGQFDRLGVISGG